ncbi:MAG: hypothetical protein PHU74_00960, partial [Candidatus Pacebacteria bacterium]|nr:hypothetical protein [Candidatus Paceibacterota bacterium]
KYQIDDVNVTVSGNVATIDLGQVNSGYAPNDGYVVFYADVSKPVVLPKNFNSESKDRPLKVLNYTQDRSSDWKTSLSGVNPGDELRFNAYYHNASSDTANNTKIEFSLGSGSSNNFTATSKISADGFNDHMSNVNIALNSSQSIKIRNVAKWYHNYVNSKYQIDDVNVTVSGNVATIDLGQVNSGYAPNDGYVVFYADVSKPVVLPKNFNSESKDRPLKVLNYTQDRSSDWKTSLSGVNPGDELRFNAYYHNASSDTANNTKIEFSLGSGSSNNFTATSKISADGFNDHMSNVNIALNSSQSIKIRNVAKWYHNYVNSKYQIDDVNVTVSGNVATIDLGQVNSGYAPNDGYVVFYADVSKGGGSTGGPIANAGANQTVTPGSVVRLNGSSSSGSGLVYAWSCSRGVVLNDSTIVNPTFTVPDNASSGTVYTCTLTVTDSNSKSSSDDVKITVNVGISSGGGGGGAIIYYGGNVAVEILDVTDNNNGSVKLNGKITECERENCDAKFIWGTSKNNLSNSTELIKNLKKGDEFSFVLKDLKKGKAYYAQIEARMETKTVRTESSLKFITRPDKPAFLKAALLKDNIIQITWKKGDGGSKILIKRGVNLCPELNDSSAPTIYFGEDEKVIDKATSANTGYCYRAWMVSSDGMGLIFSDAIDTSLATKGGEIKEETPSIPEDVTPSKPTTPSEIHVEIPQKPSIPMYELSLKNFARNLSLNKLEWQKSIFVSSNDVVEFYIELENKGNTSLQNLIITNLIKKGLKEIQNVTINNVSYSNKILDRAFIKELKPGENIKITFSAKVDELEEGKEITLLSEAYSNQTKSITDVTKITKKEGYGCEKAKASLFEILFKGQLHSWIILILIIIILSLIYIITRKRKKTNSEDK